MPVFFKLSYSKLGDAFDKGRFSGKNANQMKIKALRAILSKLEERNMIVPETITFHLTEQDGNERFSFVAKKKSGFDENSGLCISPSDFKITSKNNDSE